MILEETDTLSNGVKIPKLGLGTWLIDNGNAAKAVRNAVEVGYRHIDTAQAYGNEKGVGDGIRSCGVTRDKLFVTTKLAAEIKDYQTAVKAIDGSLQALNMDYIDLMLIHAPQPWAHFREGDYAQGNREAWKALEEAYCAGKLRAIGISNFLENDMDNILESCTVKPMVNQILTHIGNTPEDLIAYSQKCGMLTESYSPIAHGEILHNPMIIAAANKYHVTVPQLCIRYTIQLGTVSLPKASTLAHMKENAKVDFVISDADMEALKSAKHIEDYGENSAFPVFSGK